MYFTYGDHADGTLWTKYGHRSGDLFRGQKARFSDICVPNMAPRDIGWYFWTAIKWFFHLGQSFQVIHFLGLVELGGVMKHNIFCHPCRVSFLQTNLIALMWCLISTIFAWRCNSLQKFYPDRLMRVHKIIKSACHSQWKLWNITECEILSRNRRTQGS